MWLKTRDDLTSNNTNENEWGQVEWEQKIESKKVDSISENVSTYQAEILWQVEEVLSKMWSLLEQTEVVQEHKVEIAVLIKSEISKIDYLIEMWWEQHYLESLSKHRSKMQKELDNIISTLDQNQKNIVLLNSIWTWSSNYTYTKQVKTRMKQGRKF